MKQIRSSKFSKFIAYYLTIMMFLQITQPMQMYGMTSGPSQPEFNDFTPIGTSDMVDLTSGDFNYNIPIMDVGGYPLNLAYNSGISMDQEASWVGLGWNLNVGQIERQIRGLPDDFNGDVIHYENDLKDNITVGTNFNLNSAFAGYDVLGVGVGLGVQWNNYEGITFKPSYGVGFSLSDNVKVGMNFSSSVGEGATVSPSVSISGKLKEKGCSLLSEGLDGGGTIGLGLNSRKGIENLNLSVNVKPFVKIMGFKFCGKNSSTGGSISFNNQSFTPYKRVGFENQNFSFNAAIGGELWLAEFQPQITGYGSYQKIANAYKDKAEKAYGYDYTEHKKNNNLSGGGVLDFNRENERTINENTNTLPVTNYTYDIYNISGQGVSGMFRPYRSKVSYLYNDAVVDNGMGMSFGAEFGIGNLFHAGVDFKVSPSTSRTGGWNTNNNVLPYFKESNTDVNSIKYEPITYKLVGGLVVDPEQNIYSNKIHDVNPIHIKLGGNSKNRKTTPFYDENSETSHSINSEIKRSERFSRNQVIQKITAKEALNDKFVNGNTNYSQPHHTAGIKVLQTDGTTYVYGNTSYNTKKIEATFDVSKQTGNNTSGLVGYNGSSSGNNSNNSDKFLNKITTPPYAHSYQITSVLSSDYEDIDNNGPSIGDLGTYTKFIYKTNPEIYKWRVPFQKDTASFNEGLISKKDDEKATYIYGEKELVYLDKIITKTHVAFFDLEERQDAIGVSNEHGGAGNGRVKKIKSIRLYSLPEVSNANGEVSDPGLNSTIKPIKTAHFEYDYSMCPNVINNSNISETVNGINLNVKKGKLTLKKVYFTYRGSNMGKYTPYKFDYGNVDQSDINPDYNIKGYDIWGNYKVNPAGSGYINSSLSTTEYPFVNQNQTEANINTSCWTLKNIDLPSGGNIDIETESDDYQFVQNKKAMQMFKVLGAGSSHIVPSNFSPILYSGNNHYKYLYVQLSESVTDKNDFIDKYLSENIDKYINFRFLMNMTGNSNQYDYVSGYFEIDKGLINSIKLNAQGTIVSLPLKFLNRDGGSNANAQVNPITKTGWGFGRTYLNREVYSLGGDTNNTNFVSIVNDLAGSLEAISQIFTGPNKALQEKGCASNFKPEKSWIRLENPNGKKLGGGLRVKSIKLSDKWDSMLSNSGGTDLNTMEYGQEYEYIVNGKSSGVATYEPNASSENPLVEPFFPSNENSSYGEKIAAPRENNYVEKPFGENFFPSPKITYSRVTVKSIKPTNNGKELKKHATGKVVTNHYTTYDFPTKVSWTNPDIKNDIPTGGLATLAQLVNIPVRSHLTMSQGFSIETSDMDGKIKSQEVYQEDNNTAPISKIEYKYNSDENGNIDSYMTVINPKGEVSNQLIGLDYDMINDFNESYSTSEVAGFDGNLASFLAAIFPMFVPTILPKYSYHEDVLRTAVTTKHIHKTAILVETTATDLGSKVSTKNLAWDANSGQVLLTETINEYDDHYYSFNYPAYWKYEGMGLASTNLGIEGKLETQTTPHGPTASSNAIKFPYFKIVGEDDLTKIFHLGDEIYTSVDIVDLEDPNYTPSGLGTKLWVVGFKPIDNINPYKNGVLLMDRKGNYVNKCADYDIIDFKITRSGYRNLQSASMASVTSMINPLKDINNDGDLDFDFNAYTFTNNSTTNPRITNSSAVAYKDHWLPQREGNLPYYPKYQPELVVEITPTNVKDYNPVNIDGNLNYPFAVRVNPYLWNIKGDWRAEKSYAYLTGRNSSSSGINNPRNEGFYNNFSPFYQFINNNWVINDTNWTYASSVTQYSPFGFENENKDALNRYSSAQYGYQNTLPMAVASNSKYSQMGFDGFEEYNSNSSDHFKFYLEFINLSTAHSHTGRKSIKVVNGSNVALTRSLKDLQGYYFEETCPSSGPNVCKFVTLAWSVNIGGADSFGTATFNPGISINSIAIENSNFQQYIYVNPNNQSILNFGFPTVAGGEVYVNVSLNNGHCVRLRFRPNKEGGSDGAFCIGSCDRNN